MQQFNKLAVAKAVILILVLMALPTIYVLAGRGSSPADMGSDPSGAPIDGGISLLVAAGIGYGAKKVRDARKKAKPVGESDEL